MNKIFNKINNKIEVECEHDEYCPIYLAYLSEYSENSEEIKYCKNPNVQYCKKYNLINKTLWNKMKKEEKLQLLYSSYNQLTELHELPNNLEILSCHNNQLTEYP